MKALKVIFGIVGVLVVCVVLLALFAQHEETQQHAAWVQQQNAEKSEVQQFLPSIELFDLGLGDLSSTGDDQFWIREIHGRVRNKSPKSLKGLAIKISIIDSQGVVIDTYSALVQDLGAAPGDVKSFSSVIDIQRVPKGFKWLYQTVDLTFY